MILALQNVACSCSHQLKDMKGLSHKQIGINMFCSSCSLDKDVEKQKKWSHQAPSSGTTFFFFNIFCITSFLFVLPIRVIVSFMCYSHALVGCF